MLLHGDILPILHLSTRGINKSLLNPLNAGSQKYFPRTCDVFSIKTYILAYIISFLGKKKEFSFLTRHGFKNLNVFFKKIYKDSNVYISVKNGRMALILYSNASELTLVFKSGKTNCIA